MAIFNKFNSTSADLANEVFNLGTDVLKIMLSDTLPLPANAVKADIAEITSGNGYVSGGATVAIASSTQTGGLYILLPSGSVSFTASGGSIGPFRYVIFYDSTASGGPLLGWWDAALEVTIPSGNTFPLNFDMTNGILQIN
jgi:hypothetical protein